MRKRSAPLLNETYIGRSVLCGDVRSPARYHSVSLADGKVTISDPACAALTTSDKLAAFAALGHTVDERGCHGLKALVEHGLPQIVSTDHFRGWRALYTRYEQHAIVKTEMDRLRDIKSARAGVGEVFQLIRKLYRPPQDVLVWIDEVDEPTPGHTIAYSRSDARWTFEVQENWLASVRDLGIAELDGKLIVGVGVSKPGVVYAVERTPIGYLVTAEYLLDPRTRKIARIAA